MGISDCFINPEYASWSWRQNEVNAQPRQVMNQMSVIQYTAGFRPNIMGDEYRNFTFLAIGLEHMEEASAIWLDFQQNLIKSNKTITKRNDEREYPYWQMSPFYVHPAVSV